MSDKNQSDTSSSATQNTSRVKNSLLSAAVTNLTLDDFTHNAVLMPAAMPFVAAPVPVLGDGVNIGHRGGALEMGELLVCNVFVIVL